MELTKRRNMLSVDVVSLAQFVATKNPLFSLCCVPSHHERFTVENNPKHVNQKTFHMENDAADAYYLQLIW